MNPDLFNEKIRAIVEDAVAGLGEGDCAARIAAVKSGQTPEGTVTRREGEAVFFEWGGRTLAAVSAHDLEDDSVTVDDILLRREFIADPEQDDEGSS